jgi:hypothetical protein
MARGRKEGATSANGRAGGADLDAIEREHVEQLAQAHAALAAAQDRSYWLDRWGLDLNALMRRPGARRVRAALRALRELQRGKIAVQRYAKTRIGDLRRTAAEDDLAAASQNARGVDAGASTADDRPASRA